jgi:hypothetical protein
MNLEKIKENISQILDAGGSVSFDYKSGMKDWYQTIDIHYSSGHFSPPSYNIHNGPEHGDYEIKEEAIDKFVECIFNENNLAYCLGRIKKRLGIIDFEDSGYSFENPNKIFLDLIESEKTLIKYEKENEKKDPNEELFILLQTGHEKVEEIMSDVNDTIDLENFITDSSIGISNKIKFYLHMNSLFLNVLLNRIGVEFGKKSEEKAILCRNIIVKNIKKLYDKKENNNR